MQLPQGTSRSVTLAILGVDAVDSGERSGVQVEDDDAGWVVESVPIGRTERPPAIAVRSETPLTLEIETGSSAAENLTYLGLRPAGASLPETFPIVVSETFIESNVTALDDTVRLPSLRIRNDDARVIGTIEGFPTTDADLGEVVLLDLATYQAMGYRAGANIPRPASYWLTIDGDPSPVVDELRSPPINSFAVAGQQELVDNLTADPVALATIGALAIGFVAAAVFATVGFAVSATVSARERLVEFALFRALGLSRRQLAAWLSLEQGVLVVLSLLLGTLVGVLLTAVVLPLITLTQGPPPAVPPVLVRYPWTVILALEIGVVAVLAAVVTAMTVLLRRIGLGSLLRMGED
jgi:hypothetical protein